MKLVWIGAEENAGQQMIRLSDVSARFSLKTTKFPDADARLPFYIIEHWTVAEISQKSQEI